jgi:hypothetical protein
MDKYMDLYLSATMLKYRLMDKYVDLYLSATKERYCPFNHSSD